MVSTCTVCAFLVSVAKYRMRIKRNVWGALFWTMIWGNQVQKGRSVMAAKCEAQSLLSRDREQTGSGPGYQTLLLILTFSIEAPSPKGCTSFQNIPRWTSSFFSPPSSHMTFFSAPSRPWDKDVEGEGTWVWKPEAGIARSATETEDCAHVGAEGGEPATRGHSYCSDF